MSRDELTVRCAWCGCHMSGPDDGPEVSHGICRPCAEQVMAPTVPADYAADLA